MALLLRASPLAMGVIHKHQKMVTSQVSDTISETIGLLISGGKNTEWKCWNLNWEIEIDMYTRLDIKEIGEGNGTPLQYSCLENPMGGGAWWAAVYGVAQSPTRLKWLSSRYRRDNWQECTVQQGELCSIFCNGLHGKRIWKRSGHMYTDNWFTLLIAKSQHSGSTTL